MKRFLPACLVLLVMGTGFFMGPQARADSCTCWKIASPDHEQTFAYGMEQKRVWKDWGRDHHLVVLLDFTNDPYVDRDQPRQYDNFQFTFPGITLGRDGVTFYYRTSDGRSIPVARKHSNFLDFNEISLLPNAALEVDQPHGYLSLFLTLRDPILTTDSN